MNMNRIDLLAEYRNGELSVYSFENWNLEPFFRIPLTEESDDLGEIAKKAAEEFIERSGGTIPLRILVSEDLFKQGSKRPDYDKGPNLFEYDNKTIKKVL
jgi:DNA-binding LacI/PurR family transcriptional regulator